MDYQYLPDMRDPIAQLRRAMDTMDGASRAPDSDTAPLIVSSRGAVHVYDPARALRLRAGALSGGGSLRPGSRSAARRCNGHRHRHKS